jgi:hypothetical protein
MSQQIVKDHSLEALQVAASWPDADRVTLVTSRFAYTACGEYKWLLSPRGTAYFTISPTLTGDLTPQHAGRYAGDDPWSSVYSGPPRLASDARRFDVSPAWHSWVAAAPAVRLLAQGAPGPCTGTPLAWRTGSAPESAWSQVTPRSCHRPPTSPPPML